MRSFDAFLSRHASAEFSGGNRLTLLQSGVEYFPALIAALDAARIEVHLETYIFADDASGRAVRDALIRAARRGVAVRVLVDGYGAKEFPGTLGEPLAAAGGEILVFRPEIGRMEFSRRRLRRLHRKLVVVDGCVGFVGGINVIDDYDMGTTPSQTPPRFDYAVRVEGPAVRAMHDSARHIWRLVRWATLGRRPPPARMRFIPQRFPQGANARFIERDNLRHRHAIEDAYLHAVFNAREEVLIANAYFLPARRFRRALVAAAQRGVRVTLLLQGRVEYALVHYATLELYRVLLGAGVRIVEYRASFLHAKVAVVDGHWATVGSSNIDPFSLLLAREANLVVEDAAFAGELRQRLLRAIERGGVEIRHEDVGRWPWWAIWRSRLAYAAIRWLLQVGIGHPHARRSA